MFLSVWCFIWIGNCLWVLSSCLLFFFFFLSSLYCGCIWWNWGWREGEVWFTLVELAYCWTHWCYLCEVKLSIHIYASWLGFEYEYVPQDWDFLISHLGLLTFWITFFFFFFSENLKLLLYHANKYNFSIWLSVFSFSFILLFSDASAFCFQEFDYFLTSVLCFVLFWNPLI